MKIDVSKGGLHVSRTQTAARCNNETASHCQLDNFKVSLRKLCSDQSLANIIRCSARTPRTIDAKKDLHGMPNECRLDVFKVTLKVECTNTEDNRRIERRLAWHA